MKIKYWPSELQDELRKYYFYVEEEGTVHRYRFTKDGKYDTGPIGTLTKEGMFVTVFHIGTTSYCLTMPRLAYFLATGKQHHMVKVKDGLKTNLKLDNLIPIGPELQEDVSAQVMAIRAQMRRSIDDRNLWKTEVDIARRDQQMAQMQELREKALEERFSKEAKKMGSMITQPELIENVMAASAAWRANWIANHSYVKSIKARVGHRLEEVKSVNWLNGIYTGISWEDMIVWVDRMFEETDVLATAYVLETHGERSSDEVKALADSGQLEKHDYDYYLCGLAILWDGRGHKSEARGLLSNYTWLGQPWLKESTVERYAKMVRAAYQREHSYLISTPIHFLLNKVETHEEMMAIIEAQSHEAETLFNRNKVQEEKDKLAGLAAKELPSAPVTQV